MQRRKTTASKGHPHRATHGTASSKRMPGLRQRARSTIAGANHTGSERAAVGSCAGEASGAGRNIEQAHTVYNPRHRERAIARLSPRRKGHYSSGDTIMRIPLEITEGIFVNLRRDHRLRQPVVFLGRLVPLLRQLRRCDRRFALSPANSSE